MDPILSVISPIHWPLAHVYHQPRKRKSKSHSKLAFRYSAATFQDKTLWISLDHDRNLEAVEVEAFDYDD